MLRYSFRKNTLKYHNQQIKLPFKLFIQNNQLKVEKKNHQRLLKKYVSKLNRLENYGVFVDIILKGVGYSVYLKSGYLIFDLGYCHYIGLKVPKEISVERFKTRLVLYSNNELVLNNFCDKILKLKKMNVYKGKGIFINNKKINLKSVIKR